MSLLGPFELGCVHKVEALAALKLIPDASVDVLLTDPPYSSGGFTQAEKNRDPTRKYVNSDTKLVRPTFAGDNRDGRSWAYWSALWLSESLRILKPGGYALTFSDWRQLPNATDAFQAGGFLLRGIISWDKSEGARAPHKGYFRHQCEYIVWGTKGAFPEQRPNGPFPGAFRIRVRRYSDKFHVTGKPTDLMRQLVKVAPRGGVVLDPFAGSGTTLVACELEGRVGLGFELEDSYVGIANARIADARARVAHERGGLPAEEARRCVRTRSDKLRELWNAFTTEERALRSAVHEVAHGRCGHGCVLDDADRRLHVSGFFDDSGLAGWVIVLSGEAPRILVVPLGNGRAALGKLVLLDAEHIHDACSRRVPRRVRSTIGNVVLDYLGSLLVEKSA